MTDTGTLEAGNMIVELAQDRDRRRAEIKRLEAICEDQRRNMDLLEKEYAREYADSDRLRAQVEELMAQRDVWRLRAEQHQATIAEQARRIEDLDAEVKRHRITTLHHLDTRQALANDLNEATDRIAQLAQALRRERLTMEWMSDHAADGDTYQEDEATAAIARIDAALQNAPGEESADG